MMQGKMAIVGGAETITVFKAAGVDAFPVTDEKNARETLRKVARDYAVIFLTEDYALLLKDFLKRFDEEAYPVVLPAPVGPTRAIVSPGSTWRLKCSRILIPSS